MHETGVPSRQRDAHPCADDNSLTRSDVDVSREVEVTACIAGMGRARHRQARIESLD
jgi:hypothetical protein